MAYQPEAKFNAALAKLQRIDYIKQKAHLCRWIKDYDGWFDRLMSWASELDERLNKEQRKEANGHIKKISISLGDAARYSKQKENKSLMLKEPVRPKSNLNLLLDSFEKYLGRLERKFGMSIPDAEDPRKAILER